MCLRRKNRGGGIKGLRESEELLLLVGDGGPIRRGASNWTKGPCLRDLEGGLSRRAPAKNEG